MKTTILTSVLAFLIAVTFAQKSSENANEKKSESPKVNVAMYTNEIDHVTLIVMKQPEDKLNLKIRDEEGSVVYEKSLRKPENRKINFDLSKLPEGGYTFELTKGKQILYSNHVSKGSNSVALSD